MERPPPPPLAPIPRHLTIDECDFTPTDAERARIAELIEQLVTIDAPLAGASMSGHQFSPLPGVTREMGGGLIMIDHGLITSEPIAALVAFGPKAIPQLLESLDDDTPGAFTTEQGSFGGMWHAEEFNVNRSIEREFALASEELIPFGGDSLRRYTVTRGDYCFLILGEIVNRRYQPLRYQPTACQVINSPTTSPVLVEKARTLWSSETPATALFTSLLQDLHTPDWRGDPAAGAATRLLFYFPDATASYLCSLLDAVDGRSWEEWRADPVELRSRRGMTLIHQHVNSNLPRAVSWSEDPRVTAATWRFVQRATNEALVVARLSPALVDRYGDDVHARLIALLDDDDRSRDRTVVRALTELFPHRSRATYERLVNERSGAERIAIIESIAHLDAPPPWLEDALLPLLDDTERSGESWGPFYAPLSMRFCDHAARTAAQYLDGLPPNRRDTQADLDRLVENVRRRIRNEPVVHDPKGFTAFDFDALPRFEPRVRAMIDGQTTGARRGATADTLTLDQYLSNGVDTAHRENVTIDAESGAVLNRTRSPRVDRSNALFGRTASGHRLEFHFDDPRQLRVVDPAPPETVVRRIELPFEPELAPDAMHIEDRRGFQTTFSADRRTLFVASVAGAVFAIDLEHGTSITVRPAPAPADAADPLPESIFPAQPPSLQSVRGRNAVAISAAFGFDSAPIELWDHDAQTLTRFDQLARGAVNGVHGSIIQINTNGTHLYDLRTMERVNPPIPPTSRLCAIETDLDAQWLFFGTSDGAVYVSDLATNRPVARLNIPDANGHQRLFFTDDRRSLIWTFGEREVIGDEDEHGFAPTRTTSHIAVFDLADLPFP